MNRLFCSLLAAVVAARLGAAEAVGDGTHRLRLTWDSAARRARFEIDSRWDGKIFRAGSSATVNGAGIVFGDDARIFVGGANGVRFAEFAVTPLTEAEVKEAGFGESFVRDASAGRWLPAPQVSRRLPTRPSER